MAAGGVLPFISDGSASSHLIHIQKVNIHFFSEQPGFSRTDLPSKFRCVGCLMAEHMLMALTTLLLPTSQQPSRGAVDFAHIGVQLLSRLSG